MFYSIPPQYQVTGLPTGVGTGASCLLQPVKKLVASEWVIHPGQRIPLMGFDLVQAGEKLCANTHSVACSDGVVQDNADKDCQPYPVVVQKALEAGVAVAVADKILLISEHCRCHYQ